MSGQSINPNLNRREFLKAAGVGAAASLAIMHPPGATLGSMLNPSATPRRLSPGVQLFIDDELIEHLSNVKRVVNPPTRLPEPIVTAEQDKCFQPYVTVLRDPQTGRFRMWYNAMTDPPQSSRSLIGYIESQDGIHWIRPHRVLPDPGGIAVGFGAYVVDDGPNFPDRSRRYKLAFERNALYTAFSADGLNWTDCAKRDLDDFGDIISLSRDPIRNRYLLLCKVHSRPADGYKGSTPNAKEGYRRLVGQSVSEDCIHWTPPRRIIVADEKDEGITEFYSIGQVIARGGLLIGLLKVLRDDLSPEPDGEKTGIGYTCLAWTRDGETWHRDREPFMDRNPQPHTWDRAMTWGDCLLPVEDEVFIYYGGYARGHKVERFKERQIGFARMRRDRFVARVADARGGTFRTPVVTIEGSRLTVNADVAGELRIAVLDAAGQPISGFAAGDCAPITGDSLAHAVKWKQPMESLKGRPLRLEFHLRDARVYAMEV
ncbi:twin-arginine translocation signal domain-containing protein [Fontivita pretiosa]|uniref:twin-arginine translocation signal domain-containing protein n=1 Tax=Fontivita pretiosa TaxID=2989684 RepID=UPI003D17F90A